MAIYEITAPNGQVLEIEGDTPPTEAELDEIFKTTNTIQEPIRPRSKGFWNIKNDDVKKYFQDKIEQRRDWEENHPFISSIQKDFQPLYRSNLTDWEEKAQYGYKAPLGVSIKNDFKRFGQDLIPIVNIGTAISTSGIKPTAQGLPALMKTGAKQSFIQGNVLGATHELGDNGLSLNVIPETLKGGTIGLGVGLFAPPIITSGGYVLNKSGDLIKRGVGKLAQISPETVEQVIKPTSKALDYTKEKASDVLRSTTERVRDAYNSLLKGKGEAIQTAEENLRDIPQRVNVDDVIGDIKGTFDQYQGDYINPARNMTGKLENDLYDLAESANKQLPNEPPETISAIDLQKMKQQVGQMTNWADTTRPKIQNNILEQVYGKMRNRLEDLSPELAQANKDFAYLKGFQEDEGLKTILAPGGAIDRASTALKNYNSTVSKGNTAQNIQALENTLVKNGEQPFLGTMDDINAAMDLLKQEKTGLGSIAELGKSIVTRPALRAARWYNGSKLPDVLYRMKYGLQRAAIPIIYNAPRLFGRVNKYDFK